MAVISVIGLVLSFAGYISFASWLRIRREFVPIVVCSTIACAVYLCGIFGVLHTGAVAVLVLGIAALCLRLAHFGVSKLRERARSANSSMEYDDDSAVSSVKASSLVMLRSWRVFDVAYLIGMLVFLGLLASSRLEHYDNYSHWAIALKQMLLTGSFPDVHSQLISFKNYPLGTTSWLYYLCLFLGHGQAMMIVGQSVLIFASIYAVFGIIAEHQRFLLYAFLAFGCSVLSFFNITVRINNLLVDFLLPLLTLAIIAIAYGYRQHLVKASLLILPVAAFLMVVKLTGVIFAAIALIFLLYIFFSQRGWRRWKDSLSVLACCVASFLCYGLWQWHMAVTGIAALSNKFNIGTGAGATETGGGKTAQQVSAIVSAFLKAATDLGTRPALGLLVGNIVAVVASIAAAVFLSTKWRLFATLVALDVIVALYYVGILGLYVYSMPQSEASSLAGFDRYANSIVVLFIGALAMCATCAIERSFHYKVGEVPAYRAYKNVLMKDVYQKSVIVCLMLSMAILLSEFNGLHTIIRESAHGLPAQVSRVTGDNWPANGAVDEYRYLLYGQDTNSQVTDYYMQYAAKYYLFASHVDATVSFYEDNMDHLLGSYDYLVVIEPDAREQALLSKHYGVSGDEGFYKVEKSAAGIRLLPVARH